MRERDTDSGEEKANESLSDSERERGETRDRATQNTTHEFRTHIYIYMSMVQWRFERYRQIPSIICTLSADPPNSPLEYDPARHGEVCVEAAASEAPQPRFAIASSTLLYFQ